MRHVPSFVFTCLLFMTPALAIAAEEPVFEEQLVDRDFSVRVYRGYIVAETYVSSKFEDASSAGFKRLADYIFGNNRRGNAETGEKITMTAPVTTEAVSEKIAMTAPVTIEAKGTRWRVHFVMPAQYSFESLPKPVNPEVTLRQVPAAKFAVVRFSGLVESELFEEKINQLRAWVTERGLRPTGTPQLARYNPPWTPAELRRNEVLIPIE